MEVILGADLGFLGHDLESVENAMSEYKKSCSNIVVGGLEHQINTNSINMLLSEILRIFQHYPAVWHTKISVIIVTTVTLFWVM